MFDTWECPRFSRLLSTNRAPLRLLRDVLDCLRKCVDQTGATMAIRPVYGAPEFQVFHHFPATRQSLESLVPASFRVRRSSHQIELLGVRTLALPAPPRNGCMQLSRMSIRSLRANNSPPRISRHQYWSLSSRCQHLSVA